MLDTQDEKLWNLMLRIEETIPYMLDRNIRDGLKAISILIADTVTLHIMERIKAGRN